MGLRDLESFWKWCVRERERERERESERARERESERARERESERARERARARARERESESEKREKNSPLRAARGMREVPGRRRAAAPCGRAQRAAQRQVDVER